VSPTQDDSLRGRGEDELLPDKGDPFQSTGSNPESERQEEDNAHWKGEINRQLDAMMAEGRPPKFVPGSENDHGLSAQEDEDLEQEVGAPSEPLRMPGQESAQLDELSDQDEIDEAGPDQAPGFSPEAEIGALASLDRHGKIVWRWAESLRGRIYQEVDNLKLARRMLDQLDGARHHLVGEQADVEMAERLLGRVEYQLHLSRRVRRWSTTLGPRLLMVELGWLLVLFVGMLILPDVLSSALSSSVPTATPATIRIAALTALWGGVGGALSALLGLRRHMLQYQDFDRQWSLWYLVSPVVGIVFGGVVFLILRTGLSTLAPSTAGDIESAWLAYALGGLAGMQQNFLYNILSRALPRITPRRSGNR
jgi:hypothetical protein